jgi:hypothetical protein
MDVFDKASAYATSAAFRLNEEILEIAVALDGPIRAMQNPVHHPDCVITFKGQRTECGFAGIEHPAET